jgi:arylsulfatase A-like enzyme
MNRFLYVSFLFVCVAIAGNAVAAKPNIVFMLADDLGWADLGCYGADLHETPNIDHFAQESVRFPQAYMMSVCSPSRAGILTGKHPARLHITIWREGSLDPVNPKWKMIPPETVHDLPLEEVTTAKALKTAGYATIHVGKWHLGDAPHYPEAQGFDVNIGGTLWGAPNSYMHPFKGTRVFGDFRYVPGLGLGKPGQYLTDRLTDEAIRMIDEAGDQPFYLNLCFHCPHAPIEPKPELVEHYRKKLLATMHHQSPEYAAMVQTLDDNVGRVLRHLDERHLSDHTIVVFASDNGGYINKYGGKNVTNNFPLRSGKGSLYEGGIRVPVMIRWPGVTPAAGAVCEQPIFCTDFFPTLANAAGVAPADRGDSGRDGLDLAPILKDPASKLGRDTLYFHYPHYYATTTPVGAIRQGDWKLLEFFQTGKLELYNLKDDLGETKDLAKTDPDKVKELHHLLVDWRKSVGAQMPTARPEHALVPGEPALASGQIAASEPEETSSVDSGPDED